jgi:hypothetical protein
MDWRRAAIRRAVVCLLVTIAGIVLVALGVDTIGWVVASLGITLLIALAFYEVGLSEDRHRDRGGR